VEEQRAELLGMATVDGEEVGDRGLRKTEPQPFRSRYAR
jgi:hypothetical protein